MKYIYRALSNGQYLSGKVEAQSEKEVVEYLRGLNSVPVSIQTDNSFTTQYLSKLFDRVSSDDIINFTRELAIMLNAGLTITGSLDILNQQTEKNSLRALYTNLLTSIKSGDNFSKAISQQHHFSRLYVALIKAGEASGKLNDVMSKMADDLEKQRNFMSKVKGTMVYPIIIIVGVIGVIVIMLMFVVPQLGGLYKDMGVELPLSTQVMIGSSEFLMTFWPVILIALIVVAVTIRKFFAIERNKYALHRFIIKIPKVGDIVIKATLVSATRTLSLLIQSGVLMLESLSIVTNTTENVVFQQAMKNIYRSVQNGVTLSDSFQKEQLFPPILIQMIAVGERTGKLDEVIHKISDYFELQTDSAIKTATTLIEPLTLVLLGGVVFIIVMSVLTPIYTLTSSIGQ
ncbi:type II secretion system F family protein [Candidatus Woesebacteria bacterium]|nr:type II secretion system F family protein [Candidatus Woesebacteria bacterium]